MKTLYIECTMGVTTSTLLAGLYELLDKEKQTEFISIMNQLFSPDISFHPETRSQCDIVGTYMKVLASNYEEPISNYKPNIVSIASKSAVDEVTTGHVKARGLGDGPNHPTPKEDSITVLYSYSSILKKIEALPLPEDVRSNAQEIYHILSSSEALVQNKSLEEISLHDAGTLRSLANVIGNCLLLSSLNVEQIIVSPIHVGTGTVATPNGILPIPRPVTVEILKGIPYYTGAINHELCSPTGAALIKHYATGFGAMPILTINKSGFGVNSKKLPIANGLRVFYGDTDYLNLSQTSTLTDKGTSLSQKDCMLELICIIEDMTGDELGYTMDQLYALGAIEVFYQNLQLAQRRTAVQLHCQCSLEQKDYFTQLLFKLTTTSKVQYQIYSQASLSVTSEVIQTNYGSIHKNISTGYGVKRSSYDFEDVKRVAANEGIAIHDVIQQLSLLSSER